MELLDRPLQRQLLIRLSETYPKHRPLAEVSDLGEPRPLSVNAFYLEQHGLLSARWTRTGDPTVPFTHASITTAGVDFLQDDGGLGAILGVVTVRLHEDTVRSLLLARIAAAEGDEGVKARLVNQVKALPAEALSRLTEKALDASLRHMPALLQWLQTTLEKAF